MLLFLLYSLVLRELGRSNTGPVRRAGGPSLHLITILIFHESNNGDVDGSIPLEELLKTRQSLLVSLRSINNVIPHSVELLKLHVVPVCVSSTPVSVQRWVSL